MKRIYLILVALIFSLYIASATDIALVVKTSGNSNVISAIDELNYTYKVITESQISSTNFSQYAVIIVQDDLTNEASLPLLAKNSIFINRDAVSIVWHGASVSKTQTIFSKLEQLNTPFTEGFSSIDFQAYTSNKDVHYLKIKPSIVSRVALTTGGGGFYGIVDYSNVNNSRKVFFGFTEINYWTSDTKKLFKNSLKWARLGVDFDRDGYYSDSDCNDNNSSLWQYLKAYVDADKDGFGTGSLVDVCSGNSIPSGYSVISGDCNDNHNLVNPDASEIPYDYLDNDCKNGDLADLDQDGWCKKNYLVQNKFSQCINEPSNYGSDCDETNSSIKPGVLDPIDNIDQNCVNDAPVLLSNVPDIIWGEDENTSINLNNYFADPEGDVLSFSVYNISNSNISASIVSGIATFIPKKDWNGNSLISFKALDGNGGSKISNNASLTVLPVNDAPVIQIIHDIDIIEGREARIIVNASDVDSSVLYYSINDTRFVQNGSTFTWQTSIGNNGKYYVSVSVSDSVLSDSKPVRIDVLKKLVINEFLPNPLSGSEWVEIYNPRNSSFDLTGCYLEDLSMNHIQLQGVVASNGFVVKEMTNILDDSGDLIKLKCESLIDSVEYRAGNVDVPGVDESAGRILDGEDSDAVSDWKVFKNPTKGISNLADVILPVVSLILPVNNSVINSSYVLFNYTASDNKATSLNCSFYSNLNGSFARLVSDNLGNGSMGNFNANNVENGNYLWQVRCSDGRNEAGSEVRNFVINSPKSPVIQKIENITVNETQEVRIVVNASDSNGDSLVYSINDIRFTQNDNVFTWITSHSDSGDYYVLVSVSDSILTSSQSVRIIVNNLDRAPVMSEIGSVSIFEDSNYTLELNASDPDSDSLVFSVKNQSASKVGCTVNGTSLLLVPAKDFNGNSSCVIEVSDSILSDFKTVLIQVIGVNDAPVINSVNNVSIEGTQEARIIVSASDVDSSVLYYSINDTRFTQNDNVFTWITSYSDSGTYYVLVSVSDSILSDSKIVKVVVSKKNEPPHFSPISNITLDEDSVYSAGLSAYDNDGVISRFEVVQKDTSKVDCTINSSNLAVNPARDFNGDAECKIRAYDDKNAYDETFAYIKVNSVNDAPVIDSYSPRFNPIISKRAGQDFSLSWHDIDSSNVSVRWYVDSIYVGSGNSYRYDASSPGNYEVRAEASDSSLSAERVWNLSVVDKPQTNNYGGDTTDFSGMNDSELGSVNLILEKTGIGRIDFLESVDLRYVVDFDHYSDIQTGLVSIDTNYLSALAGKIARITLYGLGFVKMPAVYYDSDFSLNRSEINQICPENICQNVSYNNGTLSFISHFSSFRIGDTLTCAEQRGSVCSNEEICSGNWISAVENRCCSYSCSPSFSGIETCSNITGEIGVEIREPKDNEDFSIGDEVNLRVRIYNELDKSIKLDVEVYLYDLTDNKKVDDYDKNVRIKKSEREDLEFSIDIDSGLDDTHSYAIFARAEDDDYCSQDFVRINVERKEHDVRITNFNIPSIINCGESFEASISVENYGDSDEDVKLSLTNSELGIGEEFSFELERAGDSDRRTRSFNLHVPDYSEEKSYSVSARVMFSGEAESLDEEVIVRCDKQETELMRDTGVVSLNSNQERVVSRKSLTDRINGLGSAEMLIIIVDMFIILGIIFIILYIILKKASS